MVVIESSLCHLHLIQMIIDYKLLEKKQVNESKKFNRMQQSEILSICNSAFKLIKLEDADPAAAAHQQNEQSTHYVYGEESRQRKQVRHRVAAVISMSCSSTAISLESGVETKHPDTSDYNPDDE